MDWLEKEWYDKLCSIGMDCQDATLIARIKAKMDRDYGFKERIRKEGIEGFIRWVEIHCKDIYYAVKDALQNIWDYLKNLF